MKKIKNKNWQYMLDRVVTSLALLVLTFNVNATCFWIMHQDKLPEAAKRLRKF